MEAADADSYFGEVLRDVAKGTRQVRTQALTTYFQFLGLRPTSMQPSPALPPRQPAWCSPYPAVHAARVGAILGVRLDDIDLGNHQLTIAGRVRPLDDLTRRVLVAWLDLGAVVGRTPPIRTCSSTSRLPRKPGQPPLGQPDAARPYRDFRAAARRPQLEEALAHRADPMPLAVVFGLDEKTALHYASTARQLLETQIERNASTSGTRSAGTSIEATGAPSESTGSVCGPPTARQFMGGSDQGRSTVRGRRPVDRSTAWAAGGDETDHLPRARAKRTSVWHRSARVSDGREVAMWPSVKTG